MRKTVVVAFLFAMSCAQAFGVNLTMPTFQLLTRGALDEGLFVLRSQADIAIRVGGGDKFGGELNLSIRSTDLEQTSIPGPVYDQEIMRAALREHLSLRSAGLIVRDLFGLPIDFRYFVGEHARILTGDLFPDELGTRTIATSHRGLLAFPQGVIYDGVHAIDGTGIALTTADLAPWLSLEAAVYQDGHLGPGHYSADVRAGFNLGSLKAETFAGASYPGAPFGLYRGGVLLHYAAGPGSEFFTQVGVPRWAPVDDGPLNIDAFFFLFEPRVHVGTLSIILTLFRHPSYYVQAPTGEAGATDIIVRLVAGERLDAPVAGGLENSVRLRPAGAEEQLRATISPFVTIKSSGVVWDFRVHLNVFPYDAASLFEASMGVKTRF